MDTEHSAPTRLAFVGAGNIAGPYAASLRRHPELSLMGVYDIDAAKATEFAQANGCAAYATLDELVAEDPDIVVNLTSAPYHHSTTRALIERGATVFSEKPLALTLAQARELVELAAERGARVACAPSLWLGRCYQRTAERVLAGEIGAVRLITAEVNHGRIESWHPAPQTFYQVGPVVDVGIYALTYLTAVFGPIRQVSAASARLLASRVTLTGADFEIGAADAWLINATFESGQLLGLRCNFYVGAGTVPRSVSFHGDAGSLRVDDLFRPDAPVSRAAFGEPFVAEPPGETLEVDWSLGVLDLADALRTERPHRTSVEHAAHIVEVLEAVGASARSGRTEAVASTFPNPFRSVAGGAR
ncbi:MAG: oxidoreductase [Naasia sp.]|nr:oxidoreductase [Naasia sp.]